MTEIDLVSVSESDVVDLCSSDQFEAQRKENQLHEVTSPCMAALSVTVRVQISNAGSLRSRDGRPVDTPAPRHPKPDVDEVGQEEKRFKSISGKSGRGSDDDDDTDEEDGHLETTTPLGPKSQGFMILSKKPTPKRFTWLYTDTSQRPPIGLHRPSPKPSSLATNTAQDVQPKEAFPAGIERVIGDTGFSTSQPEDTCGVDAVTARCDTKSQIQQTQNMLQAVDGIPTWKGPSKSVHNDIEPEHKIPVQSKEALETIGLRAPRIPLDKSRAARKTAGMRTSGAQFQGVLVAPTRSNVLDVAVAQIISTSRFIKGNLGSECFRKATSVVPVGTQKQLADQRSAQAELMIKTGKAFKIYPMVYIEDPENFFKSKNPAGAGSSAGPAGRQHEFEWCEDIVWGGNPVPYMNGETIKALKSRLKKQKAKLPPSLEALMREGKPASRLFVGHSLIEHCDKKGRGVIALDFIPQGTMVLRYAGELIDEEEEIRRNSLDGDNGSCYAFEMEFPSAPTGSATTDEQKTTIGRPIEGYPGWFSLSCKLLDARNKRNAASFVNHSCKPNLASVELPVPDGPTWILYYSRREILPGEELTIDYLTGTNPEQLEEQKKQQKGPCFCNSGKFCRGWVI